MPRDIVTSREAERIKAAIRQGEYALISNLAVRYRDLGNRRRAYYWWERASLDGDGDAHVDVGYCLQYGIGVRRDAKAARRSYMAAIRSQQITQYVLQEARYHLAVLLLDAGPRCNHDRAKALLRAALEDGQYPEAAALCRALDRSRPLQPCRCRRGLRRSILGQAKCGLHSSGGHGRWIRAGRDGPTRA